MRAMAESRCHFVIGASHELANVAVRAVPIRWTVTLRSLRLAGSRASGIRPVFS